MCLQIGVRLGKMWEWGCEPICFFSVGNLPIVFSLRIKIAFPVLTDRW